MGPTDKQPEVVQQAATSKFRRPLVASGLLALSGLVLTGCSAADVASLQRLGLPEAAGDRAPDMFSLWIGTWVAAAAVGFFTWGLIFWVIIRYRRRHGVEARQTRYNLPMELFYTAVPFVIIGVLFYYTIIAQDKIQAQVDSPQHTINVVGQKWSWTFNYNEADNPNVGNDVWEAGTAEVTPKLYLPVNETVRFNLTSPDVIHSFWIPSFYRKLDVVPGRTNSFDVTPTKEGEFAGRCAELCGTLHSAMIFNVKVVSTDEYNAYLKTLASKGNIGENLGPQDSTTITKRGSEEGGE